MTTIKKDAHVSCFGDAVVQVRKKARIGVKELAKRSGVPLKLPKSIENGSATGNDFWLAEICKIAIAAKVRPSELMGIYDENLKKAEGQ